MNQNKRWEKAQREESECWSNNASKVNSDSYLEKKKEYWKRLLSRLLDVSSLKDKEVLDYGCGPSGLVIYLQDANLTCLDPLMDKYLEQFQYLHNYKAKFINGQIETFSPENKFDVIFGFNSLDHVADMHVALERLQGILINEGKMYITLNCHTSNVLQKILSTFSRLLDPPHPHQHTVKQYKHIMEQAGFTVEKEVNLDNVVSWINETTTQKKKFNLLAFLRSMLSPGNAFFNLLGVLGVKRYGNEHDTKAYTHIGFVLKKNLKFNKGAKVAPKAKLDLKPYLLVIFSVIVGLSLGEIGLRIVGIKPTAPLLASYQFDETLGWKRPTNTRVFKYSQDFKHYFYYNSDGFPTTREKQSELLDKNKESVVLIGDSFTEGYYLPIEQSFPYRLGEELPESQVVNLGVAGYAPEQYLLSSRTWLPKFSKVSAIGVLFFPYNDLMDLDNPAEIVRGYERPIFGSSFDKPINTPLEKRSYNSNSWLKSIAKQTSIYSLLEATANKDILTNIKKLILGKSFKAWEPEPKDYTYSKQKLDRALSIMNEISKGKPDAKFFVYYIPIKYELFDQDVYKKNISLYQDSCRLLEIDCYSFGSLVGSAKANEAYLPNDSHLSKEGSTLLAAHLKSILQEPESK